MSLLPVDVHNSWNDFLTNDTIEKLNTIETKNRKKYKSRA